MNPELYCRHGAPRGGQCRACEENLDKPPLTPEYVDAVWCSLYHHPRGGPVVIEMLTGQTFQTPPPVPTEEQKRMASDVVEDMLGVHYKLLDEAMVEVTGEGLDDRE